MKFVYFPQLALMDPATGVLTGESFTLKYCVIEDVEDFLVLRLHYELAVKRNWRPGDRFRSIIGNAWWEGDFIKQKPFLDRPKSEFASCCIR